MTAGRSDALGRALAALRSRIAAGGYPAEHRFAAAELAAEFSLSPTPVREILARLAGEGLLEDRRGQGYFLRRLSGRDVAELYQLNLSYLKLALACGALWPAAGAEPQVEALGPVAAANGFFDAVVTSAGGRVLASAYLRQRPLLARVRRVEPRLFVDLGAELQGLAGAAPAARVAALQRFHLRRIRNAAVLADAADSEPLVNRL